MAVLIAGFVAPDDAVAKKKKILFPTHRGKAVEGELRHLGHGDTEMTSRCGTPRRYREGAGNARARDVQTPGGTFSPWKTAYEHFCRYLGNQLLS